MAGFYSICSRFFFRLTTKFSDGKVLTMQLKGVLRVRVANKLLELWLYYIDY